MSDASDTARMVAAARLLVENHAKAPPGHRPSTAVLLSRAVLALHEQCAAANWAITEAKPAIEQRTASAIAAWLEAAPFASVVERNPPTVRAIAGMIRAGAWRKP